MSSLADLPPDTYAGPGTLCNSCGIRWRRDVMRKEQELREKELKAEAMGVRLVRILPPGRWVGEVCKGGSQVEEVGTQEREEDARA
jgi:hypothetical protein